MIDDAKEEPKKVTIEIIDGTINVNHSMPHHEFLGLLHTMLLHENINTIKPHVINIVKDFELQETETAKERESKEESVKEAIKEHYLRLEQLSKDMGSNQIKDEHGAFLGQMSGILHVLQHCGIKIEGVNDK